MLCTYVPISASEFMGGMKNNPVLESRLVSLRILDSLSSSSGACRMLRSLSRTTARRVLNPERLSAVRMELMSALSCSSALWESEAEMLKKARSRAGTLCWCLLSHRGLKTPSGKTGEPGDRGERGECSSVLDGLLLWTGSPSDDGD